MELGWFFLDSVASLCYCHFGFTCARKWPFVKRIRNLTGVFEKESPRGLTFTWWGCYGWCPSHKPAELAHSFYPVRTSICVFVALSTVFHFINSPDNSLFSHSVLPVLCLLYWFYQQYVFLWKSPYMVVCVCCEIFQLCCRNVVVGFKWLVCRVTERWIRACFQHWYNRQWLNGLKTSSG